LIPKRLRLKPQADQANLKDSKEFQRIQPQREPSETACRDINGENDSKRFQNFLKESQKKSKRVQKILNEFKRF
jgi:hypothetical protein